MRQQAPRSRVRLGTRAARLRIGVLALVAAAILVATGSGPARASPLDAATAASLAPGGERATHALASGRRPPPPCREARQTGCRIAPTRTAKQLYYRVSLDFTGTRVSTLSNLEARIASEWTMDSARAVLLRHVCGRYPFPGPVPRRRRTDPAPRPNRCPRAHPEGARLHASTRLMISAHESGDTLTSVPGFACAESSLVRRAAIDGPVEYDGRIGLSLGRTSWGSDLGWVDANAFVHPGQIRLSYRETPCTQPVTGILLNPSLTIPQERGGVPLGFVPSVPPAPDGAQPESADTQLIPAIGNNYGNTIVTEATIRHTISRAGQTETWDLTWVLTLTPCPNFGRDASSC